jgi:hypothetical protein
MTAGNGNGIHSAFAVKTSHYVIGGFALVTALAWNSSIKTALEHKFPMPQDNVKANLIYAVIITLILVLIIFVLPDTKSELPESTQKKIETEQERYLVKKRLHMLERKLGLF